MRLIDADALEESLENSCKDTYETKMFVDFMSYVDEAPTVETYGLWRCILGRNIQGRRTANS